MRLRAKAALVGLTAILIAATAATTSATASAQPSATHASASALDWQALAAGPAPASNPLKGFIPYAGS